MNSKTFTHDFQKNLGLDKAQKIAKRSLDATTKASVSGLPQGDVFYKKNHKGQVSMEERYYARLNGFWSDVYNILKKYK